MVFILVCLRVLCGFIFSFSAMLMLSIPLMAGELRVAVASNFAAPIGQIGPMFEASTGHQLVVALGATGQLYAQIVHGAPFDVLLAADDETPRKLEQAGLAVAGTRMTYATGRLVLWSKQPGLVDPQGVVLQTQSFAKLALANPRLAPYGSAAQQVLQKLGLRSKLASRLVEGANIGQTYLFVEAGAADLGFVALSQVQRDGQIRAGSAWLIPQTLHSPILQDAVLLQRGQSNLAAQAFMQFLQSNAVKAVIRSSGYLVQ